MPVLTLQRVPSTPLIWFTAGFALASLAGVFLGGAVWLAAVGLACVSIGFLLRGLGRWPQARRLLAGAGIALVWLVIYGAVFVSPAQAMENRTVQLDAVVTRWPERTDYGARVILQAGEGEGRKVSALLYGDSGLSDLRPGDKLSCVAYCTPADASRGEDSLYYASQGIHLSAKAYGDITVTKAEGIPPRYALTILSGKIRQTIDGLYPEHEAGFLRAILTGDKSGLEQADKDNFNRVGLGHVVVISGLHVTFLMGVLTLFLDPRKKRSLLVLLPVLLAFCLMTGSGPGTVRAAILCTLALLAPLLGREYNCFTGLSTALLLLLAWNPWAAANAGLQFSFLSTLGILLFGENWCKAWLKPFPRKAKRWLRPVFGILTVSLAAMVFTVPLSWYYFGRFSLIAPLANLCASWAVSLAFVGGALSVLVGAVCFPVGHLLAELVGLPIRYFFWFAGKASQISLAAVEMDRGYYAAWALFVYGFVLLYLLAPVKEKRPILPACACVVTLCLSALLTAKTVQRQDLALTVLDVGQGQSVVVTSQKSRALVDCGGTKRPGDTAATYLQSIGSSDVDLLVLTHFHEDHAGGVPELLDRVRVGAIAVPDVDPDSPLRQEIEAQAAEQGIPIHYVTETCQVALGQAQLTLYAPVGSGGESNEQCVSVLCAKGTWEALLTGDMPGEEEVRLANREKLPDIECLIAGHHGSKYSTSEALLQVTRPDLAMISVGRNTYGHPAPETLARLEAAGAAIYRTDRHGSITIYAQEGETS